MIRAAVAVLLVVAAALALDAAIPHTPITPVRGVAPATLHR